MSIFAQRLKELRKQENFTKNELAELLNTSSSIIDVYEQDLCEPNIEMLNKIADFFHVTIDYLLGRENIEDNKSSSSILFKDFILFRKYLRSNNLSVNEQYLMELLFEWYNYHYGYAYPTIKELMKAFNTTSSNRILTTIKKLENKGLIKIDKVKMQNNKYFIIGIEKFIVIESSKFDK